MSKIEQGFKIHYDGATILFMNDNHGGEWADHWKYKIVGPYAIWGRHFDTPGEAVNAAFSVLDNHEEDYYGS